MERKIRVDLGKRGYDVRIGPNLLSALGDTAQALAGQGRVVIISDSTVAGLYGQAAIDSLKSAGLSAGLIEFPAGETHKNLSTFQRITDSLFALAPAIDRETLIVALGGGVAGDVAGFVAATALRGLPWMQCPTTLLADVDASVGGKTGIDHPAGKNLIGAFHQPKAVLIDITTLGTLPAEQLASGLAECVKHAMIRDAELLSWIESQAPAILAGRTETMTELVARNVAIKAAVVSADEREGDVRAHLNFGHTIGHGIERFVGYGRIGHGQAVSLGMVAACDLASRRSLIGPEVTERLVSALSDLSLPVRLGGLDGEDIWRIMQHDKKARGGRVRMVLPTGLGSVDIFDDILPAEAVEAIARLEP